MSIFHGLPCGRFSSSFQPLFFPIPVGWLCQEIAKKSPMFGDMIMFASTNLSIQTLQHGKEKEWWKVDYLNWFFGWSVNATWAACRHKHPFYKTDEPPFVGPDTRELVSKNGVNYFIRDIGGKGRTFLPGIFCLAWYAEEFGLDEGEALKKRFEAETLIPFETYFSAIRRP